MIKLLKEHFANTSGLKQLYSYMRNTWIKDYFVRAKQYMDIKRKWDNIFAVRSLCLLWLEYNSSNFPYEVFVLASHGISVDVGCVLHHLPAPFCKFLRIMKRVPFCSRQSVWGICHSVLINFNNEYREKVNTILSCVCLNELKSELLGRLHLLSQLNAKPHTCNLAQQLSGCWSK